MAKDTEKTAENVSSPQTAEEYSRRGWLFLAEHESEKAVSDFQTALKMDADLLDAAHGLGKAYMLLDREDEANEAFDKAITLLDEGAYEENARADMLRRMIASARNAPPIPIIPMDDEETEAEA